MLDRYFSAFRACDDAGMAACYAETASFKDPVFDLGTREDIATMWRMLCQSIKASTGDQWRLEYEILEETPTRGRARWTAQYLFTQTGRRVINRVESEFELADGLIVRQRDQFDFWRWARQALGPIGWLLGWSVALQDKIRARAADRMARSRKSN